MRKPTVFLNIPLTRKMVRGEMQWVDTLTKTYPSYKELKKDLPEMLKLSTTDTVTVYRSRRGQWGEWYEKWAWNWGKLKKFEEGWM